MRPSESEESNPLTETYQDDVQEEVEDDVEVDEMDPRQAFEPQLTPLTEHDGFKRTWERFHDRLQKRMSLIDATAPEEERAEELGRYLPPWADILSLTALQPVEAEQSEIYESYDPDLKETWEDEYYRGVLKGDLDLDAPGGDWGETRMTFGITPPAKIYFRGMIDASRDEDNATVLELFNAALNDQEIARHEIPAGMYRLAMEAYAEFNPGEARKCFQKIAETNSLTVDDYEVLIQSYLLNAEPVLAADAYSALLHSHLKPNISLEAHKLGYVASQLSQDKFNSDRAAAAITHFKGAGASAVPSPAEISLWALNNAYQKNDMESAMKLYMQIKDTYSAAAEDERANILGEASYIAMKMYDERSQFDKVLEAYRFVSSELGDKWFLMDATAAELAMRAFVYSNEPHEAQRMLDTFLEAEDDTVDEISVTTFSPIIEAAVLSGSQELMDSTFARVQELGLAEDQSDYAPLYIAAMKAKPDDVSHVIKLLQHFELTEENVDVPVEITLKALIKAERWEEAEKLWRTGITSMQFRTVGPYIQGLKVMQRKKDLDAITSIARSVSAGGVPITYGFARDLAQALFKALPDKDDVKNNINGALFRRIKAEKFAKEHPDQIMPRNQQSGVLHVIEQCRSGVQELFVD